jgi:hypothetical protein
MLDETLAGGSRRPPVDLFRDTTQQCLIEEFVAQASVETLDERVLGR